MSRNERVVRTELALRDFATSLAPQSEARLELIETCLFEMGAAPLGLTVTVPRFKLPPKRHIQGPIEMKDLVDFQVRTLRLFAPTVRLSHVPKMA